MTIEELDQAIRAAGKTGQYDLRTIATPDSQPSDMTVLEPAADDTGRWVVYYTERGQIVNPSYFDTEEETCDFVYARLTEPPRPLGTLTPEGLARAAELAKDTELERRQMLRDAGYDPDTLRKIG